MINEFTGRQFPGNQIPSFLISPIALKAESLYPLGNISPSLFSSTQILTNNYDQGGFRLDHYFRNSDQLFVRYSTSSLNELDPLPINGSNVPGFPVDNQITTNSFTISDVHLFSPRTVQTIRAAFFRNVFFYGEAQNHTPASNLGFEYQPTLASALGSPYLIVSGYSSVGNPITGPQNTYQNDYQGYYSLASSRGRHNLKFGVDLDRQQINVLLGIATNGFFVFAPFPVSDSFASFLVGQSVQFFQGGGDFNRGLRKWITAGYAQDEWRVTPKLTLTYGLRYEVNTPYTEIRNRLNAWAPGQQSTVMPMLPKGCCFPAMTAFQPELPRSTTTNSCRASALPGILPAEAGPRFEPDMASSTTASRMESAVRYRLLFAHCPGPRLINWPDRVLTLPIPTTAAAAVRFRNLCRPATILTVQSGMLPPYSQNWNFSIERSFGPYLLDVRYVGNKGTHLPRFIEANPSIYSPGATSQNSNSAAPMRIALPMAHAPSARSA